MWTGIPFFGNFSKKNTIVPIRSLEKNNFTIRYFFGPTTTYHRYRVVRHMQYWLFLCGQHLFHSSFRLASYNSLVRRAMRHVPGNTLRAHYNLGVITPIVLPGYVLADAAPSLPPTYIRRIRYRYLFYSGETGSEFFHSSTRVELSFFFCFFFFF